LKHKKVDAKAVESVIEKAIDSNNVVVVDEIIKLLEINGFSFGDNEELSIYAKRLKTRQYIGRILKKNKRKYLPLFGQISLVGDELIQSGAYCASDYAQTDHKFRKKYLGRTMAMMKSLVTRSPLIPEEAAGKIIKVIDEVFGELMEKGA